MFVHPKTPSPQKHSKLQSVRVKRPLENHPIAATHNAEEEFAAEDAVAAAQPELSVSNSELYGIGFGNIERIGLSEASMQISYNHEPVPLAQATRVDVTGSNTSHPITANPISAETAAKKGDAFVASEKVFDCKSKFKPSNHLILLLDLSPSMAKNSNATKGKLFDSCVDSTQPEIDQQGNEDYDYNPMDNATNATNATIATVQASSSRNCNVDCSSGCDGLRSMLSKDGLRKFLKDKYSDSGYGRLLISGFSGKVAYVDGCHMRGNIIGVQNDNSAQHGAYEQELAKCALQKSVPLDDGQAIDKLCEAWIEKVSKMDSGPEDHRELGDGTNYESAIKFAYAASRHLLMHGHGNDSVDSTHVVLVTDGCCNLGCTSAIDLHALIKEQIKKCDGFDRVSLSSMMVGNEPSPYFLTDLCNGRIVYAETASDIPKATEHLMENTLVASQKSHGFLDVVVVQSMCSDTRNKSKRVDSLLPPQSSKQQKQDCVVTYYTTKSFNKHKSFHAIVPIKIDPGYYVPGGVLDIFVGPRLSQMCHFCLGDNGMHNANEVKELFLYKRSQLLTHVVRSTVNAKSVATMVIDDEPMQEESDDNFIQVQKKIQLADEYTKSIALTNSIEEVSTISQAYSRKAQRIGFRQFAKTCSDLKQKCSSHSFGVGSSSMSVSHYATSMLSQHLS